MRVRCDHADMKRCPWPKCPHKVAHELNDVSLVQWCEGECWSDDLSRPIYKLTRCVPVKEKT
jgi:hypothetical protein